MCFWKFPCLFISCVFISWIHSVLPGFLSVDWQEDDSSLSCIVKMIWIMLTYTEYWSIKMDTKIWGNKFIMQSRLIFGKHGENIEQSILPWKVQGFIPNHILSRYVAHICGSHQKDVKEGESSQRTREKGYGGSSKRKKAPSFQPRLSVTRGCRRRSGWGNPLRTRARQVQ